MQKFCLALDLKDDAALIAGYEAHHQNIWPAIQESILQAGIHEMEIYRVGNRLFMIIEAADDFSFEQKNEMDKDNADVQEWERLMWTYQQALPAAKPGEKWMLMEKIFQLKA